MDSTLYREEILEHYRSPLNFGRLRSFDISSRQLNPFCGDEIIMFIDFGPSVLRPIRHPSILLRTRAQGKQAQGSGQKSSSKDKITDISFFGKGCAISIASASILSEYAKGKTKNQLTKFSEKDMLSLLGIEVTETRKKCALLALAVLRDCISYSKDQKAKIKNTD